MAATRNLRGNTITTREVRSLAAGGKEMSAEITIGAPAGEQTIKQVFTKSS